MIRIVTAALAAILVAAPVFAAEAPKAPVTLKSAKQGDVTFKHDTHKDVKCDVCHKGEPGKITPALDQKAAHALCQDCHKKDATKKAPVKCTECHHKAK
jgi:class III cytochrome C family protein